ncbi:MAG: DHA2 family efflux MFS transporter permease subunit [Aliidongia sp.]
MDRPINRPAITVCVMLATIMQALDTTIANVALPYMQGTLSASQDQINWVLTSYIVAAAIMTPPTGWLAQRFGRTRLFMFAVAGFTIASVLCGLAQSLGQMVLFRLLQGVFGASLVPLSQAVLLDINPREKQGSAMAIWGVGVMVGPILGPTLGGWLTENYDWRWVFFINIPIGIVTLFGMATFLPETRRGGTSRFDWFGFTMLSIGLASFQLMLDRGEQLDWFGSPEIVAETVVAGLGFYLFIVQILTAEKPFVSRRLFKDRNFVLGLVFIFMLGVVLLATLALLTPYLQTMMGYPVLDAGMVLAPRGAGTMLAMFLAGRAVGRIDTRLIILGGLLIGAHAMWTMTGFTPDISEATIMTSGFEQGFGLGFVFVALSTVTFSTLTPELRTEATGIYALCRNIGSSIGISVVMTLLQTNTQRNHAEIAGHVTPFNRLFQSGAAALLWNPATPAGRAALDGTITQQALAIAYIDDFKLMMMVSLASIPLLLLFRRPARAAMSEHGAVLE